MTSPNRLEEKEYERRRKIRRANDREKDQRILHCAKRIVQTEALFNSLVDDLMDLLGLTREKINNQ